jgi:catechol 2,3-dioxygenase-like lactoylglutathione lyase family enzyme
MRWISGLIGSVALATALLAATHPAGAADAWSGYGMIGVKIAVKDFQNSIEFYRRLGMKEGPRHNPAEQELNWGPGVKGPRIILVHDVTGRITLPPGNAALMMETPDVAATAKALRDAGFAGIGDPRDTKMYAVLMLKDPDGNSIELLGPPSKGTEATK